MNELYDEVDDPSNESAILNAYFYSFLPCQAQALAAIASKSFRIAFALATLEREAKSREFDDQASKEKKSDHYSPVGNRRRWVCLFCVQVLI